MPLSVHSASPLRIVISLFVAVSDHFRHGTLDSNLIFQAIDLAAKGYRRIAERPSLTRRLACNKWLHSSLSSMKGILKSNYRQESRSLEAIVSNNSGILILSNVAKSLFLYNFYPYAIGNGFYSFRKLSLNCLYSANWTIENAARA